MTTTNNKIALITGGSCGPGKNMALKLAKSDVDVMLTYHKNKEKAEEVTAEIDSPGQQAEAFQMDTGNTGKTTTDIISSRIAREAKIILRQTDWNISEIAFCLGFEEDAHFSNFSRNRPIWLLLRIVYSN